MNPSISFIMPAYKASFLGLAIDSIVGQTIDDWELVIVDDASPYELGKIVTPYLNANHNIRYYRNDINIGGYNLVAQWNHCLKFASGDWVVMAGDDDLYAPTFCEECIKLIKKYPMVDLLRSRVKQIDENGRGLYDDGVPNEYVDKYSYLSDWLTAKIFTCVGNYVFRKAVLLEQGGFVDFPCAFCSDIATPIALSTNGVANTQDMLFSFRHSSVHLSAAGGKLKEKVIATTQFYMWLEDVVRQSYVDPTDDVQRSIVNQRYIHLKCIYDYFNHVLKYVPWKKLLVYLSLCENATIPEKFILLLRRIKSSLKTIIARS